MHGLLQATRRVRKATSAATRRRCRTAGEFLTFRLGAEEYGIEILKVQEIRGYEKPTAIANTPAFIKGVINLRGTIVPIVDLRIKFELGERGVQPVHGGDHPEHRAAAWWAWWWTACRT